MISKELKNIIKKYDKEIIELRRYLHMYPEISGEEIMTTKKISEELKKSKIEHEVFEPSGVVAEIKGSLPGKTVALRADMDALSVDELNDVEYKSQIPGKMHACGHDAHTAMLLYSAKALNEFKNNLSGNVRFIFQPSEENTKGAKILIEKGCMEGVDNIFGLHVDPKKPSGKAAVSPGPAYASSDIIKITFKGKGGHGAMPHEAIDAVVMASSFVLNLQTVVSRKVSPLSPAVVTIGKLTAGTRFNIIAETALLEGTVRYFEHSTGEMIKDLIYKYASDTAALYGGAVNVEYEYGGKALINEPKSALLAQNVIKEAFGENALCQSTTTTWGEDFSYYLDYADGAFASLGTGFHNKENPMIHNGYFDIDESSLIMGAELLCQYAYSYLELNKN